MVDFTFLYRRQSFVKKGVLEFWYKKQVVDEEKEGKRLQKICFLALLTTRIMWKESWSGIGDRTDLGKYFLKAHNNERQLKKTKSLTP